MNRRNHAETIKSESLNIFRVLLIMSRFKSSTRADLWKVKLQHKYIPAPSFGRFMVHKRFERLRKSVVSSKRDEDFVIADTDEKARWGLVDKLFLAINSHRASNFAQS